MLIEVDPNLDTPPYAQIEAQIRAAIERGELLPDAALPTVRQLAGDLGVAPNTVARAYADLQDAGLLVSEGRRGTRVSQRLPEQSGRGRAEALRSAVSRFFHDLQHRGYTDEEIHAAVRTISPPGS